MRNGKPAEERGDPEVVLPGDVGDVEAVLGRALDPDAPTVTLPPDGGVTDGDIESATAPGLPGAATAALKYVDVVMTARRPWSIGQSIGLSTGYTFVPGEVTEVAAEDAAVLCGSGWDGRTFERVGA